MQTVEIRLMFSLVAVLCALTVAANLRCVTPVAREEARLAVINLGGDCTRQPFADGGWGVPKELMPDGIHPSDAGYGIWLSELEPHLSRICK